MKINDVLVAAYEESNVWNLDASMVIRVGCKKRWFQGGRVQPWSPMRGSEIWSYRFHGLHKVCWCLNCEMKLNVSKVAAWWWVYSWFFFGLFFYDKQWRRRLNFSACFNGECGSILMHVSMKNVAESSMVKMWISW